nr:hypothetical protein [Tanacetum cinerariifolium]
MKLYMMNRQHDRMILESIENGPLIWPTIEENGVTRPRKYSELSVTDAIQADCDVKATNIILQGLPPEVYALVSNHRIAKELWERVQLLMQGTSLMKQEREYLGIAEGQATQTVITHNVTYQADDLDAYESEYNELNTAKVALMANLSHYSLDVLTESENSMNSSYPSPSCKPTKVEVRKELPKSVWDIVNIVVNSSVDNASVNMHGQFCFKSKCSSFDQYFELNELKAQSKEKDTAICKLKERIKLLSGNMNKDKVKKDIEEIETTNIELDHRVSKLVAKNKHLKQTYKKLYDLIKPTHVRSKEQCDALTNQVNQKSVEIFDLNANPQEKVLIIAALRDELRKLKRKALVDNAITSHNIALEILKIDMEPLAPRLLNNRTVHSDYLRLTQEHAVILRKVLEQGKS